MKVSTLSRPQTRQVCVPLGRPPHGCFRYPNPFRRRLGFQGFQRWKMGNISFLDLPWRRNILGLPAKRCSSRGAATTSAQRPYFAACTDGTVDLFEKMWRRRQRTKPKVSRLRRCFLSPRLPWLPLVEGSNPELILRSGVQGETLFGGRKRHVSATLSNRPIKTNENSTHRAEAEFFDNHVQPFECNSGRRTCAALEIQPRHCNDLLEMDQGTEIPIRRTGLQSIMSSCSIQGVRTISAVMDRSVLHYLETTAVEQKAHPISSLAASYT